VASTGSRLYVIGCQIAVWGLCDAGCAHPYRESGLRAAMPAARLTSRSTLAGSSCAYVRSLFGSDLLRV